MRQPELAVGSAGAVRMPLVDWIGVALGGVNQGAATSVKSVVRRWGGGGNARILPGGPGNAAAG